MPIAPRSSGVMLSFLHVASMPIAQRSSGAMSYFLLATTVPSGPGTTGNTQISHTSFADAPTHVVIFSEHWPVHPNTCCGTKFIGENASTSPLSAEFSLQN